MGGGDGADVMGDGNSLTSVVSYPGRQVMTRVSPFMYRRPLFNCAL